MLAKTLKRLLLEGPLTDPWRDDRGCVPEPPASGDRGCYPEPRSRTDRGCYPPPPRPARRRFP